MRLLGVCFLQEKKGFRHWGGGGGDGEEGVGAGGGHLPHCKSCFSPFNLTHLCRLDSSSFSLWTGPVLYKG